MSNDKTIIYVSSNREDPEFEKRVRETLVKNSGGLPIISVTQKPIDFGTNICVGDVGASGFNFVRQIQIATEAAKTKFVIHAESDCLYPPDYFEFTPPREDIAYRNTNIYVLKYKQGFFKKRSSTFAQTVGRDWYLERLNYLFAFKPGLPKWDTTMFSFPKEIKLKFLDSYEYFTTKNPCISFKTGRGMRIHTVTKDIELQEIPYWGSAKEIRNKYE